MYRVFHGFGQAKFPDCGLVLGSSQFTQLPKLPLKNAVEGGNIEYGNIEKCNIDTKITSKIWRLVTSKKNDGNIKFSIDLFNIDSKNGVKRGQTGS